MFLKHLLGWGFAFEKKPHKNIGLGRIGKFPKVHNHQGGWRLFPLEERKR